MLAGQHQTLDAGLNWLKARTVRGDYDENTSRLWETAAGRITSVLTEDESRDVEWLLENLDDLIRRWLTKNPAMKAGTGSAYKSRFKNLLEEYLRWSRAPEAFKPMATGADRKEKEGPKPTKAPSKKGEMEKVEPQKAEAQPEVISATPVDDEWGGPETSEVHRYRLGRDRGVFEFKLPEEGLKMHDVWKILHHLTTWADDFDPADVTVQQISRRTH